MHPYYQKFANRLRGALENASQMARYRKHPLVSNLHLLWGLLSEGDNLAVCALKSMKLDISELKYEIENLLGHGKYNTTESIICYDQKSCEIICKTISLGLAEYQIITCHHLMQAFLSIDCEAMYFLDYYKVNRELFDSYVGAILK